MSSDFFKVKKGLNIKPTDPAELGDLEDGDIIIDSTDDNRMKVYDSAGGDFSSVGTGGTSGNFLTEFEKLTPDLSNVTSVVDTVTFLPIDDNNKSVKATWAASAGYIQYESAVPADVEGQGLMTVWLKTSVQGLTLSTTTDGVVQSSVPVIANNKWKQYEILYAIEGTEQGFRVEASGSVTGDVFIDEAFVGLAPAVSTTLSSKGQLQGYSTENSNIGPCTNNQVLVYDTSEATGWKCYDGLITTDYDDVPVGTVMSYGSETLPAGYLLADGQCVLKAQYAELYGVIGANTTECTLSTANDGFNVPNLENAFLRGRGGARTPFDTEGQAIQSHNHDSGVYVPTAWNKQKFGYTGSTVQRTDTNQFSQDHRSTLTGSTGGGETRPANTSVVYMIKAVGRAPITNVAQPDIAPNKAGFVTWAAFDSVIQGHLKANGDCVLKTDYPDYFKNVGTTFGECTITTTNDGVNLPDLITDNRFIRAAGGSLAVGNIQTDATAVNGLAVNNDSHNHSVTFDVGGGSPNTYPSLGGDGLGPGADLIVNTNSDTHNHALSGDSETRPNNMALTPYVRMVDNDIITGTFEAIEEVDTVKTAETADHLSARVNFQGGTPLQQNYKMADNSDWVTCTRPSTGSYDCSFASGLFTSPPMVHVSVRTGAGTQYIANPNTVTSTQLTFQVTNLDYAVNDVQFEIFASKDSPDVTSSIKGAVVQASSLAVECQRKFMAASTVNSGSIASLQFNNLEIGKKYEVCASPRGEFGGTVPDNFDFRTVHNGGNILELVFGSGSTIVNRAYGCRKFTASATTVTHEVSGAEIGNIIRGTGGVNATYVDLCELPDNYILNSTKWD